MKLRRLFKWTMACAVVLLPLALLARGLGAGQAAVLAVAGALMLALWIVAARHAPFAQRPRRSTGLDRHDLGDDRERHLLRPIGADVEAGHDLLVLHVCFVYQGVVRWVQTTCASKRRSMVE